jgi:hypothetical protein
MPAHTKSAKSNAQIAVIGIDIGKCGFRGKLRSLPI